jgi:hypothetical protein
VTNLRVWQPRNKNRSLGHAFSLVTCLALIAAGAVHAMVTRNIVSAMPSSSSATSSISKSSITVPNDGATVSGSLTVSANVSNTAAIMSVQIQVDGSNVGSELWSAPYSTIWDTSTLANGSHTLTAIVQDVTGSRTTSASTVVTILNDSQTVIQVGPSNNWCKEINAVAPGTTVVMAAGLYTTPCAIRSSGTAASPIVIRSANPQPNGAVLAYPGTTSNVLDVYGDYLEFEWLTFTNMKQSVDAIRIRGGHDVTVLENNFEDLGGTAVVFNGDGTVDRISVLGNTIQNSKYTPIYLGCQDGIQCHATNVLVENNFINGVHPASGEVGYGMEVKLNSFGTIRNNTVYDTHGPCIEVYGSDRDDPATLVVGNYVQGSARDAGINISGGPAIVLNNVSVGNAYGGIYAEDYHNLGLQKNVWIAFNTVIANKTAGIVVQNWSAADANVLAYNAIGTLSGEPSIEPPSPSGTVLTNVKCEPATSCFDQPVSAPYDLWPLSSGPLLGAAGQGTQSWRPSFDFTGAPRGSAADVGAFQRTGEGKGPAIGGGKIRPPSQ